MNVKRSKFENASHVMRASRVKSDRRIHSAKCQIHQQKYILIKYKITKTQGSRAQGRIKCARRELHTPHILLF